MTFDPGKNPSPTPEDPTIRQAYDRYCRDAREHGHEVHLPFANFAALYQQHSGTVAVCDLSAIERGLLERFLPVGALLVPYIHDEWQVLLPEEGRFSCAEPPQLPVETATGDPARSVEFERAITLKVDTGPGYPVNVPYDARGEAPVEYDETTRAGELRAQVPGPRVGLTAA